MSMSEKTRIVILGGGFGGVTTARRLERLCKRRRDVEIILVSRDNFVLMTPLLFEVCSGALDARHCSLPIRAFLRTTRFVEAAVQGGRAGCTEGRSREAAGCCGRCCGRVERRHAV